MRRSDGFTLVEVLVAASVGLIVFLAAMALLGVAFNSSYGVVQRTDAMQRGRLALDTITRELRSQVCPSAITPSAVTAGSTDKSITLYVDLTNGADPTKAVRHTLTFDANAHQIVDTAAGRNRLLLDRAYPDGAGQPFLRYWAYPSDDAAEPTQQLPVPLSATSAQRVARIDVAFLVQPQGTKVTNHGTTLEDQVAVRGSSPDDDPTYAPCP